jgi:hypothetical protein
MFDIDMPLGLSDEKKVAGDPRETMNQLLGGGPSAGKPEPETIKKTE